MRDKVIKKYQNKCGVCFLKKEKMHIHHIDGQGSSLPISKQNNDLENLMLVCAKCHYSLEKNKRGAKKITTWAIKYNQCVICKKTNNKHRGKGFCSSCYEKKIILKIILNTKNMRGFIIKIIIVKNPLT